MNLFLYGGPRLPFGFRLGIAFDPRGWWLGVKNSGELDGAFLYIIRDEGFYCKVGVSKDPLQRLRNLQTGHPGRLELAWCAVTPGTGYPIEALFKRTTEHLRTPGGSEWLDAPMHLLEDRILGAASVLNEPIQPIPPVMVPRILEIARNGVEGPSPWHERHPFLFTSLMTLVFFVVFMLILHVRA